MDGWGRQGEGYRREHGGLCLALAVNDDLHGLCDNVTTSILDHGLILLRFHRSLPTTSI